MTKTIVLPPLPEQQSTQYVIPYTAPRMNPLAMLLLLPLMPLMAFMAMLQSMTMTPMQMMQPRFITRRIEVIRDEEGRIVRIVDSIE